MSKDYYAVLELDRSATQDEIRTRYRFLASFYHPDVNPGSKREYAQKKMQELNEAYYILGDPVKRAEYDRGYNGGAPGDGTSQHPAEVSPPVVKCTKMAGPKMYHP